ncbi:hypothetical protein [Paracoccus sp. SY]|uniref:hypothetical protein n=1 Tax=Paracoccus sp. SY TaxID=1330255 RepID=UPI000CCFD591|nr:hypothetical protein [Paracoccus sp. SY]
MNTTTATTHCHRSTQIISLGILEVFIDRCPERAPRPSIEHAGHGEMVIDAGHYSVLVAPKVPSKDSLMAAAIGTMIGAAGVFWAMQL